MITILSSRGFTEGGPCYVVFCHSDHVFLPKATDPVLCIPGASNAELPPPFLIPFHAPSHSTSRFNKEVQSYLCQHIFLFLDQWPSLEG